MPISCDDGHNWFNLGYDYQCGVCGVFFKEARDKLAAQCEALGMNDAAVILRASTPRCSARATISQVYDIHTDTMRPMTEAEMALPTAPHVSETMREAARRKYKDEDPNAQ